jgi:iron complex transport system substrate-binding protein
MDRPILLLRHWVPEMIEISGGKDPLGRKGADSARIAWSDIESCAPEILIVAPCGFDAEKSVQLNRQLLRHPGWRNLPALRQQRVFSVNANGYFARPGLRIVDGVELLAHLIHPHLCNWQGPNDAFRPVNAIEIEPMNSRNSWS